MRASAWEKRADGSYAHVCNLPCSAFLLPKTAVRVVIERWRCGPSETEKCTGDDDPNGLRYDVPNEPGRTIDVTARTESRGKGGFIIGGSAVLAVGTVIAVASATGPKDRGGHDAPEIPREAGVGFGAIVAAVGTAILLGGVASFSSRPRLETELVRARPRAERSGLQLRLGDQGCIGLTF